MGAFAIRGKITGLAKVLERLARFKSQSVRNRILRPALQAATKPLLDRARANVPVDQGWLRRSLGRRTQTYRQSGVVMVLVGPRTGWQRNKKTGQRKLTAYGAKLRGKTKQRPTQYAHLVEFGTRPHSVARGARLKKKKGRTSKPHPGARPRPFLQPAFDALKESMAARLKTELADRIAKELSK